MNAWLKRYAADTGAAWVDYHQVLDDGTGAMKPGLASDGVHPTAAGYDAMATVVEPVLRARASGAPQVMKLRPRYVAKPWGRTDLPPIFSPPAGERIGEVWFEGGADLPLLAKYLFTSERLSVQVHPNDEQARARGLSQRQERMLDDPGRGPGRDARAGVPASPERR